MMLKAVVSEKKSGSLKDVEVVRVIISAAFPVKDVFFTACRGVLLARAYDNCSFVDASEKNRKHAHLTTKCMQRGFRRRV